MITKILSEMTMTSNGCFARQTGVVPRAQACLSMSDKTAVGCQSNLGLTKSMPKYIILLSNLRTMRV